MRFGVPLVALQNPVPPDNPGSRPRKRRGGVTKCWIFASSNYDLRLGRCQGLRCDRVFGSPEGKTISFNKSQLIRVIHWLIDNIYVTFGDKIFKQKIGIPMGTDCAPFLANLFLWAHEFKWIEKQVKKKKVYLLNKFKACCRYIDDLFLINNDDTMKRVCLQMYPKELKLIPDDTDGTATHFLDLSLTIE